MISYFLSVLAVRMLLRKKLLPQSRKERKEAAVLTKSSCLPSRLSGENAFKNFYPEEAQDAIHYDFFQL